jgi:chromosomal replication initiation ATPase DnaA
MKTQTKYTHIPTVRRYAKKPETLTGLNPNYFPLLKGNADKVEPNTSRVIESEATEIITRVSEILQIPIEDLKGKCREREIQDAAKIATFLIREKTGMSFKKMGTFLNRDHSSIITRINEHKNLMFSAKYYQSKFNRCNV